MFKKYDPLHASNNEGDQTPLEIYEAIINLFNDQDEEMQQNIQKGVEMQLHEFLKAASQIESLLCFQYLYAAFSMKKYDSELQTAKEHKLRQIEMIRRWEARILYVARQEMEHLNLVQNLLVLLDKPPYLKRPNFPIKPEVNPLGKPINLMPFSVNAVKTFRYWEKPDSLELEFPEIPEIQSPTDEGVPLDAAEDRAFNIDEETIASWEALKVLIHEIIAGSHRIHKAENGTGLSIERLYNRINIFFYYLIKQKLLDLDRININRIVVEHFGFNLNLDPIVKGKYYQYVNDVITGILEEGEGVWGVPPPLASHFTVYQEILNEYENELKLDPDFEPALPCLINPSLKNEPNTQEITNKVGICAVELFNACYEVLDFMLYGFFLQYNIDYTTGVRPPIPNSFFRTSFYPFMTMVIRPLGEIVCRLPADKNYKPVKGKIPDKTAGPNFYFDDEGMSRFYEKLHDQEGLKEAKNKFLSSFDQLAKKTDKLRKLIEENGYHVANASETDARDFDVRLHYLQENIERIAINFEAYWDGKIEAPIPSENFQNFSNPYN